MGLVGPLFEKETPLLNNSEEFISEFKAYFEDNNSVKMTINKIRRLRQGDRPTSSYAADFHLLATDIPWDDQTLMEQFRYGLRNDVKNLFLTFPKKPKSLKEAISRAVRWDNRLSRSEPTYTSVIAKPFARESYNASPTITQHRWKSTPHIVVDQCFHTLIFNLTNDNKENVTKKRHKVNPNRLSLNLFGIRLNLIQFKFELL